MEPFCYNRVQGDDLADKDFQYFLFFMICLPCIIPKWVGVSATTEIWFLLVYNKLKCIHVGVFRCILLYFNTMYDLDILFEGNEGVCPPFVNYFVEKLLQRGRNSAVCNSNCHYSENTNLNRNVASSLCIPIKGKHLFLVLDVHVCDPLCLRYMHLRVWFPALCNLVYKYWIAVICESLAKRIISQHQFNVIE